MEKIHLSAETMARLLSDSLTAEELAVGEAHLRVCPECCGKLDELTTTAPTLAALLAPPKTLPASLSSAPPGFELLGVVGVGKTAVVYRARQPRLGRLVALKVLSGGWPSAAEARRRFQTEIEAAASQNHPHIVQVFEVGTHQEHPFLVMEYCGGGSLAERLRNGLLPPRQAAALIELLARALHTVHGKGFVHRDLKPANILFDSEDRPKVADFGVVKRLDAADTPTPVGSLLGTPPYLAPEQIDSSAPAGPRCDVYALGAILYECLIGRPPFRAESIADTLFDVLHREPMPPRLADSRLPRDLETICLKCLEKEPARRYGSALELAEDLYRFLHGQAVRARRVGPLGRSWRWLRRNPLPAALAAALLLAIVAGLGMCSRFWYQAVASQRETESARRLAEENFLRTRRLLPDLVTAGSGPAQLSAERQQIRRTTLERACGLYRELCRVRPADSELCTESAHVLTALATAALTEGRYQEAAAKAEEALVLWRRLRGEAPRELHWRAGMARALLYLAKARKLLGRSREMAAACREAVTLCQGLADVRPSEVGFLLDVVAARECLSRVLWEEAKKGEAHSQGEEICRQLESYRAAGSDSIAVRMALVKALYGLGHEYQARSNAQAAIRCWREGLRQSDSLHIALPHEQCARYYSTACALRLPHDDPDALTPAQAIPRLEQAMQLAEFAYAQDADSTWEKLAMIGRTLADCYHNAGRPADALRIERRAAQALPPLPEGSAFLDLVRLEGIVLVARREQNTGQTEAARRHAREVADGFEAFCRTHAEDAGLLYAAIDFCPRLIESLRHAEATDQSRRVVVCALQVEQRSSEPSAPAHIRCLADIWVQMAKCRMRDDRDGVEAALLQALDLTRRLVAVRPEYRFLLDDRLARLARWFAECGRRREAVAYLRERESLCAGNADGLRGVARGFRDMAKKMEPEQKVLSSEEKAEQAGYLAEALRLEKAADSGFPLTSDAVPTQRRWFGTARVGFLWKRGAHVPVLQRELAAAIRTSLTAR